MKSQSDYELRDDQFEDLVSSLAQDKFANLNDPGTGKTPTAVAYTYAKWSIENVKTIWTMPTSLYNKNKEELLKFSEFEEDEVVIYTGQEKYLLDPKIKVFIMSFNRLSTDWAKLLNSQPQINCLVVDEWHMGGYKNSEGKRSQELFKAMKRIKYFLPLTGTLISGRLDSCYTAIKLIEPRYYADQKSFVRQHAIRDAKDKIVGWKNHTKIGRILDRHSCRRKFTDIFKGVNKIIYLDVVEMDNKTKESYDIWVDKALLELEDEFLEAPNGGVHVLRCRQIMAHPHTFGILEKEDLTGKEERVIVHLMDHINTGEPLVIFCSLRPECERYIEILNKLGITSGLLHGGVDSKKERPRIDSEFREGKIQVLVATYGTASVGYNWGHCNHIICTSLGYDNVDFVQACQRVVRGKRETPALIHVLAYKNSIDYRIMQIQRDKSYHLNKVDSSYEVLDFYNYKFN